MVKYKQRTADRLLERKVLGKGAVLIEGPKWCGKTTTAKQLAKSVLDLGDASVLKQSTQMIEISPKSLLEGKTPRLIDEWQALPPIWDSIRSEVDKRSEPSQFILTGSSVLPDADETIHSGTGRFAHIMMRPMSLYESGESSDTDKMPAPSFLAVIVGVGKYAYQRKDGVYVIPIGCLKD